MHWLAIGVLALVSGWGLSYVQSAVNKVVPASQSQNTLIKSFANGVAILVTIFIAVFILSIIGMKPRA